jgi:tetratricopeptide (TPR) repeat protein
MAWMTTLADPRVLLHNAQTLERAGRHAEAEAVYVEILKQWPELADTWYNLALLQRRLGKFAAALESYAQSLRRGASQPEQVHLNRAVIYSDDLRQGDAAEIELNAALQFNPQYVPALLNLANLREDYGKRESALALYERILQLDPRQFEALARYANVQTPSGADDPLIARLEAAIHDSSSAAERASLGFALGKTFDAAGAYDAAFDAYTAANRNSRASAEPTAPVYDRARQESFVAALIKIFARKQLLATPLETSPTSTPQPIFVCGMFRSGSTLTEQILATHPRVAAGGELGLIPGVVKALAPFPASMHIATRQRLTGLAAQYLETISRLFPGAALVTDKRPDNFLYIGLIKQLFPAAKIVHTTRQPLDNCLSVFFLHLDHSMSYALDLMDTAHYYVQQRRLMAHWRTLYGEDILEFDYDAFVRNPDAARAQLFSFCGLRTEEATVPFEQVNNAVKTASVWQVRQPVYRSSSGRWRHYAAHLNEVAAYLHDLGIDN